MATRSTTRLRKASCPRCGYVIRLARKWILRGLPECPCGAGALQCEHTEDQALCDELALADLVNAAAVSERNRWVASRRRKPARCKGCGSFVSFGHRHCARCEPEPMPF